MRFELMHLTILDLESSALNRSAKDPFDGFGPSAEEHLEIFPHYIITKVSSYPTTKLVSTYTSNLTLLCLLANSDLEVPPGVLHVNKNSAMLLFPFSSFTSCHLLQSKTTSAKGR